ncbi:hypothetical protein CCHR01_06058 [Colletotrichum chrysophilum]|uniref:Uncharacterized protein n=1 Tax=Colletotrichum chrysophilum TaxID=1836956 RepID=A0AAD9EK61_9PEZI|nr:hypothetical protein CCHR01_06058 [Colletotrichum chrysophilum]
MELEASGRQGEDGWMVTRWDGIVKTAMRPCRCGQLAGRRRCFFARYPYPGQSVPYGVVAVMDSARSGHRSGFHCWARGEGTQRRPHFRVTTGRVRCMGEACNGDAVTFCLLVEMTLKVGTILAFSRSTALNVECQSSLLWKLPSEAERAK